MHPSPARWDPAHPTPGRFARFHAMWVTRLRWWLIGGWTAVAVASTVFLPALGEGSGGGVDGFVPADTPAISTEVRSVREFGFPLLSRIVFVQRDPDGLSALTQAESFARAAAITRGEYDDTGPILGAIPVPNTLGLFPGSGENGTTMLTLLFIPPDVGFADQFTAAQRFADRHFGPEDAFVGVTGSVPARVEQGRLIQESLPWVEGVTVAAVVLIVALNFRSLVAPVVMLAAGGVAILVMLRLVAGLGRLAGVPVPGELEPLLVALLLGVVTDYAIFYLSALRRHLGAGGGRVGAAQRATTEFTPIIVVAGLTVAAGTAALLAAESALFRAFGPGMALAILVGLLVSVTLVPALMAVLGGWSFWPGGVGGPGREGGTGEREGAGVDAGGGEQEMPGPAPARLAGRAFRGRSVEVMTRRPVAGVLLVGCVTGLVLAALPVRHLDLGLGFVPSLPAGNDVRETATAAKTGFAAGILSPTTLLVEAPDVTSRRAQLQRLGDLVAAEPGVAGLVGPGSQPLPTEVGVVLARGGDAARFLIVLDHDPLGAHAIDTLDRLRDRLPDLLAASGLEGVRAGFAGDTAIAQTIVGRTTDDLGRLAFAGLTVNLLLLVAFLRALVAPLYLLGCSVLALLATLGLTTFVFQDLLGHDGLTFYVPFAAAVLLVALGSDYNIFGVGHIWEEARRRPLRRAIVLAVPQTTRAITAAGITLATSFGLLALVPLRPFRELAFAMFVGILLDAVVVRSLLVPALLTLVGRASAWPGPSLRR